MAISIFYSWQSDINQKVNRNFIKKALQKTIRIISKDFDIEEAIRLDHDTKGVPGSPDIFNTILQKIEGCSIFICDLTGVSLTRHDKIIPNPNVLVELGYAMKTLGDEKIIGVMNEAFGKADALPFNLAHKRWPIRYTLNMDSSNNDDTYNQEQDKLIKEFLNAIKMIQEKGLLNSIDESFAVLYRISNTEISMMLSDFAPWN